MISIISWNVNGIRACIRNGFLDFLKKAKADIYCLQEIKIAAEDLKESVQEHLPKEYTLISYPAQKKGYSGLITLTKQEPTSIVTGIGHETDSEGRVLITEYNEFYLLNTYFPNAQEELARLDLKLDFDRHFANVCKKLETKKPLIITGDLNVAHKEIDIKNAKQNERSAGFTIEERNWMSEFLAMGYIDTFREFVKEGGHYTWWTYRFKARERNAGWRLDYFIISKKLRPMLTNSSILNDVYGSDHCPIKLELNL